MHRAAPQTRTRIPVSHGSGFDLRLVLWRPAVIATFQILSQVLDPDPPLKTSTLSTAIFLLRISHSLPAPWGLPKPVPKLLPPHLLLPTCTSPSLPASIHPFLIHFNAKLCWSPKGGGAGWSDLKGWTTWVYIQLCLFLAWHLGQDIQPLWAFPFSSINQDKIIPCRVGNNNQMHVKVL